MVALQEQIRRFCAMDGCCGGVNRWFCREIAVVSAGGEAKCAEKCVIRVPIPGLGQPPPSNGKPGAALEFGRPPHHDQAQQERYWSVVLGCDPPESAGVCDLMAAESGNGRKTAGVAASNARAAPVRLNGQQLPVCRPRRQAQRQSGGAGDRDIAERLSPLRGSELF
jgi:hypothetical protein